MRTPISDNGYTLNAYLKNVAGDVVLNITGVPLPARASNVGLEMDFSQIVLQNKLYNV